MGSPSRVRSVATVPATWLVLGGLNAVTALAESATMLRVIRVEALGFELAAGCWPVVGDGGDDGAAGVAGDAVGGGG